MYKHKINVQERFIEIRSNEPITKEVMMCIETAYLYVSSEYSKLDYIMNKENRILEAKYNAIEAMQQDCETLNDKIGCDLICQYIINLEFDKI
jgi:hypothetical protein